MTSRQLDIVFLLTQTLLVFFEAWKLSITDFKDNEKVVEGGLQFKIAASNCWNLQLDLDFVDDIPDPQVHDETAEASNIESVWRRYAGYGEPLAPRLPYDVKTGLPVTEKVSTIFL